jgi:hypothetical protein
LGFRGSRSGIFLSRELQQQIIFGEPSHFLQLLVSALIKYGKLKDGRNALEAVLVSAKDYVGRDKRAYCESLLQQLRTSSNVEKESPNKPAIGIQLVLEGSLQDIADEKQRQVLVDAIAKILDIEKQAVRVLHVTPAS